MQMFFSRKYERILFFWEKDRIAVMARCSFFVRKLQKWTFSGHTGLLEWVL